MRTVVILINHSRSVLHASRYFTAVITQKYRPVEICGFGCGVRTVRCSSNPNALKSLMQTFKAIHISRHGSALAGYNFFIGFERCLRRRLRGQLSNLGGPSLLIRVNI